MSIKSKIEWTDATWNPVTGCTKVSPGCKNCYAETFSERFRGVKNHPFEKGFDLRLWNERLYLPLKWKNSKRVFVNSMSDLFHVGVSDDYIRKVFDVMCAANHHIFQILTKRSSRLREWTRCNYLFNGEKNSNKELLPSNIWLGVSVENKDYISRINDLQKAPAPIRFISFEPLIGPINLNPSLLRGIHWIIVGGESGPRARLMRPEWVNSIYDQCQKANVPFFFKQWGMYNQEGEKMGKKAAGRIFLGRTWDNMPRITKFNFQVIKEELTNVSNRHKHTISTSQ